MDIICWSQIIWQQLGISLGIRTISFPIFDYWIFVSPSCILFHQAVLDEQSKLQQAEAQIQVRTFGPVLLMYILPSCKCNRISQGIKIFIHLRILCLGRWYNDLKLQCIELFFSARAGVNYSCFLLQSLLRNCKRSYPWSHCKPRRFNPSHMARCNDSDYKLSNENSRAMPSGLELNPILECKENSMMTPFLYRVCMEDVGIYCWHLWCLEAILEEQEKRKQAEMGHSWRCHLGRWRQFQSCHRPRDCLI